METTLVLNKTELGSFVSRKRVIPQFEKSKLDYIDSLRGVAILMVILVHTSQKVPGLTAFFEQIAGFGQMGVQLFFVLSAYTLCLSLEKRKKEKKSLLAFYIRRFFRIAPLYYFGIILYFIVSLIQSGVFGDNSRISEYTFKNVIANVFFYHGFYPPAVNNIVFGGWSIGAEMAFYAIVPFLYSGLKRVGKNLLIFLIPFIGVTISISFFELLPLFIKGVAVENNNVLYYNLTNQFPVFLLGITFFFYEREFARKANVSKVYYFVICFIIGVFAFYLYKSKVNFTLIPFVAGISFLFLIKVFQCTPAFNIRVLQRIGQLSFSIYILHFLFAYYGTDYLVNHFLIKLLPPELNLVICFLMSIVCSVFLAKLTERTIEKRGSEIGKQLIKSL